MTKANGLLASLDEASRADLVRVGRRRRFRRREIVFHEGDPGDSLHLIEAGRFAARIATPRGDIATLSVMGAGQAFGELALIDPDSRRTATIVALEPSTTLVLHRSQLDELRVSHPEVEQLISSALLGYVLHLSDLVLEALYVPAEKRVARRLAELAALYTSPTGDGAIALTQEDIASMAGTSRATVNRVLGELTAAGAVRVSRGSVVVDDLAAVIKAGR